MLQVSAGVQLVVYGGIVFVAVSATAILAVLLARPASRGVAIGVGLGLAGWFAAASALAQVGFLGGGQAPGFAVFGLRFAVPLVLVAIAFAAFEPLRRAALDPELQPSLIAIQTFRVIGGVFLVLLALNALPAIFAVPAGTGDVLIGLTAPVVARSVRAGRTGRAITWNLLGLLDFVVAVTVGVAASPGPLRVLTVTPSTAALSVLPLVLIPTFLVPLAAIMHLVSLRALTGARETARAYS
jgi:hypothetical protein